MQRLTLTLAALFLLASCSDQPTTPQALTEAVPAPSFDFSNGPAEPGHSYIVRDAYGAFAFFLIDPVTELAALITDDDPCIDFAAVTLIPVQNIFSPSGEGLRLYFEGGWVNAAILEPPYACDDVLATGLVHNVWHDNDFYAFLFDHNRVNSFGGAFNGKVGAYSVSWNFHVVWGGLDNPDFKGAFSERISIK